MDPITRKHLDNLQSEDANLRYEAFSSIISITHQPVDWAYEVWDDLLAQLQNKNNHQRAIAAQVLCNLAKSDPGNRMLKDLDKIMEVTWDERFVTARHTLQSLWKIAAVGKKLQTMVVERLVNRYHDCIKEKNCTLIRFDIIQSFRRLYDQVNDKEVKEKALELIQLENDPKYQKKYEGLWKDAN